MNSIICGLKTYRIRIALLVMLTCPLIIHANVNKDLISNTCHSNELLNQYETKNKRDQKKLRIMAEGYYLISTQEYHVLFHYLDRNPHGLIIRLGLNL